MQINRLGEVQCKVALLSIDSPRTFICFLALPANSVINVLCNQRRFRSVIKNEIY